MATIQTGSPYWYYGGNGGATQVVGWESSRTRVARHQFKTTSLGASSVSWTFEKITFEKGSESGGLRWYIGESSTSHADAGVNSAYHGKVNISSNTASGSADIVLKPNTTYYLWVFPASQTYGWWWWIGDYVTIDVVGSSSKLSLSPSSVNVGDTITANIGRSSTSFTHTVEFYINSDYQQIFTDVGDSQSFTIPDEWYNYMSKSTECKAYCRVTTYNNGEPIGSQVTQTFTVKVPTSIVPEIGIITLTPDIINSNKNTLVKGKNKLTIKVTSCSAGTGSSIKSYTFSGPSFSKTVSSDADNASASITSVSSVGELTYQVTVTDARGRSASNTAKITCYDYYAPSIKHFRAYRAKNSAGDPDENGTYIYCSYETECASVNETNKATVTIYYSDGTTPSESPSNSISIGSGKENTTYKVYAKISDSYGGESTSGTETLFGGARIFNIRKDGTGVALGKMSDLENSFECKWDATFYGDVDCQDITINQKTIFDLIYPVGSIYMSVNSTNPKTIFGGEWEQLKDRFLLGAGSTYSAGNTGGSATHTLTINEIPSHSHSVEVKTGCGSIADGGSIALRGWSGDSYKSISATETSVGGGKAHNNMPPYLVVYMWKRTA